MIHIQFIFMCIRSNNTISLLSRKSTVVSAALRDSKWFFHYFRSIFLFISLDFIGSYCMRLFSVRSNNKRSLHSYSKESILYIVRNMLMLGFFVTWYNGFSSYYLYQYSPLAFARISPFILSFIWLWRVCVCVPCTWFNCSNVFRILSIVIYAIHVLNIC